MNLTPREPTFGDERDDDDEEGLPVLTDVIDEVYESDDDEEDAGDDGGGVIDLSREEDTINEETPPIAAAARCEPAFTPPPGNLEDALLELEIDLNEAIETWIDEELPQIILRELDAVAERIHDAALANLRTTVLPQISERIARALRERENQADPL